MSGSSRSTPILVSNSVMCLSIENDNIQISVILKSNENLVTIRVWHCDFVLSSLLDHAIVDELAHQVGSSLPSFEILLHLLHLSLQGVKLGQFLLSFSFPLCSSFLFSLDLFQSASPFAADLEHVGRHTFGN